jgi:hypothetical protein
MDPAEIDLRTTVTTEPGQFGLGVIDACPECHSKDLCAVHDGRGTNVYCNSCGACWSMSLGWVTRVNPSTCPGCGRRAECLAKQKADELDKRPARP